MTCWMLSTTERYSSLESSRAPVRLPPGREGRRADDGAKAPPGLPARRGVLEAGKRLPGLVPYPDRHGPVPGQEHADNPPERRISSLERRRTLLRASAQRLSELGGELA